MPCELLFEVYSTNTLVEGLDIVKREVGMDPLTSTGAALAQELQKLKDCSRYNGCLFSTWYAFKWWKGVGSTDIICFHESPGY